MGHRSYNKFDRVVLNGGMALICLWILLVIFMAIGWVMNLIAVIHLALNGSPLTTMFILRAIGVPLAILGGVLGWM